MKICIFRNFGLEPRLTNHFSCFSCTNCCGGDTAEETGQRLSILTDYDIKNIAAFGLSGPGAVAIPNAMNQSRQSIFQNDTRRKIGRTQSDGECIKSMLHGRPSGMLGYF